MAYSRSRCCSPREAVDSAGSAVAGRIRCARVVRLSLGIATESPRPASLPGLAATSGSVPMWHRACRCWRRRARPYGRSGARRQRVAAGSPVARDVPSGDHRDRPAPACRNSPSPPPSSSASGSTGPSSRRLGGRTRRPARTGHRRRWRRGRRRRSPNHPGNRSDWPKWSSAAPSEAVRTSSSSAVCQPFEPRMYAFTFPLAIVGVGRPTTIVEPYGDRKLQIPSAVAGDSVRVGQRRGVDELIGRGPHVRSADEHRSEHQQPHGR